MLMVAGPTLIVSLLIGLAISIVQAATSIQEYTLTFVPKVLAIAVVIILLWPWTTDVLLTFTRNLFQQMPNLAK
jgi:flagellar biosynthetic protein FliQ